MPQYRNGQAVLARPLPAPLPGRRARAEEDGRQPRRHVPARRDLAARQLEGRLPARLLPAHAVPGQAATARRKKCGALDADGYAHHAYTTAKGPRFVPARRARRDARRALAARARARPRRQGRRAPARAADLPDRVRHPVAAGPHPGRLVRQAGGVPLDRRAHGLREPARALVLAVPDDRRHAARVRAEHVRRASRAACARARARRSRPTRRSGCRSRSRTTARTDVLWGLVRQYRAGDHASGSRSTRAGKKGWRKLADVKTTGTGVYSLRATHRKGQRYRVKWTSPARQALLRRRRPRVLTAAWTIRLAWPFVRLGSGPDGPTMGGRRSFEHHENPPDASPRSRRRRRQRPLARTGRRHVSLRRRRRAGDGRAAPAALRRAADAARLGAPAGGRPARRALHAASGRGLARRSARGRHADEDPWRSKTYWYYEDHAVAARA